MSNVKVLIATPMYPPNIGGPATYSKLLMEGLGRHNVDADVISFDVLMNYPKGIRHLVYIFRLMTGVRGFTHIYAQDPVSVGLPAYIASFLARKKFFVRVAGDYAWEQSVQRFGVNDDIDIFQKKRYGLKTNFLKKVQIFVCSKADKVITPSKYFQKLVGAWSPRIKEVVCIYNGIELPEISYDKKGLRKKLGLNQNQKVMISAGRLVPWKGFSELIKITDRLSEKFPNLKLIILGDGPQMESLKAESKELELQNKIMLVGRVGRDKMFEYLAAADVFVLNTTFESFSFQVVEAMHAGLPVITRNIGSLPELVDDGSEGYLISGVEDLKNKIVEIFSSNTIISEMSENAKIKARKFSVENTVNNFLNEIK